MQQISMRYSVGNSYPFIGNTPIEGGMSVVMLRCREIRQIVNGPAIGVEYGFRDETGDDRWIYRVFEDPKGFINHDHFGGWVVFNRCNGQLLTDARKFLDAIYFYIHHANSVSGMFKLQEKHQPTQEYYDTLLEQINTHSGGHIYCTQVPPDENEPVKYLHVWTASDEVPKVSENIS